MLVTNSKSLNSVFERIIRDKNGILVRVRFIVVEVDGEFQAQIVSAEALKKPDEVLCLPVFSQKLDFHENFAENYFHTISPYLSLEFFMSQPTRAPSA